jgi:hypothetical protein
MGLQWRCVVIGLLGATLATSRSAAADVLRFSVPIASFAEVPASRSSATGTCDVTVDSGANTVTLSGSFSGLGSAATAAAIHGLAPYGAVAPAIVPATTVTPATAGSFSGTGSITGAEVAGLLAGEGYCEIDDAAFPTGEIRGQIRGPSSAPAVERRHLAILWLALGLTGALVTMRRGIGGENAKW